MSPTIPLGDIARAAVLEVGERLTEAPSKRLTDIAFSRELQAQKGLVTTIGWVDLAHTMTLAERGVIPRDSARALVAALLALHEARASFAPAAEYGDLYTNREAWLAERTEAVGWLGVARARREALTTAYHLTLCDELLDLGEALAKAAEALNSASLRRRDALMPDYTYLQAAQPTTFGHYLQSFAWPILRDLDRVQALYDRVDQSPAGIGSSNGSVTMQDRPKLADRLGFRQPVRHARDAMWQADIALEAAAVAVTAAVNLDRLAEDLMIFASAEFGFVRLADRHARASKIMPHKRNPYALAFVRAVANRLIGVQAGMAAAARTPSGQMDNRFFAYEAAPDAVRSAGEAASLVAECVDGLSMDEARAFAALDDRSACASDLAERLMAAVGIDYRCAHGVVGRLVGALEENKRTLAAATASDVANALRAAGLPFNGVTDQLVAAALNPTTCVASRRDVGGASPEEVTAMAAALFEAVGQRRRAIEVARAHREAALRRLHAEAEAFAGDAS
ncbi:lyase family protein [Methylocapsa aurea]|uniref:lyase family protein n=1 Tax=Methylocapsa aurea TaxID=663610 RepID=UPI000691302D|nr:lyase family protein [Methylocapsa aurea]